MAAEAVIIELFNGGRPIRYTCADGATIEKGTLARLTDPRTVVAHSAVDQPIAGIVAQEKVALDGATTVSVYTDGIFDLTAAAAGVTALGARCAGSGTANMITAADANDLLQSSDVGMCLEAHANDEVAAVRVNK
jgi:hypothetical protein